MKTWISELSTRKTILILCMLANLVLFASCTPRPGTPPPAANLPNPASVYCEQQGNRLEIRTAADGSQSGVCIFPDGSQCDEWAYYRGECGPASQANPTSTPIVVADPPDPVPTEIPTPMPIEPGDYQGWWTYTHAVYHVLDHAPGGLDRGRGYHPRPTHEWPHAQPSPKKCSRKREPSA